MNYLSLKDLLGQIKNLDFPFKLLMNMLGIILFAHQLFIRPTEEELATHEAEFHDCFMHQRFKADPAIDGTNSETFIIVSYGKTHHFNRWY